MRSLFWLVLGLGAVACGSTASAGSAGAADAIAAEDTQVAADAAAEVAADTAVADVKLEPKPSVPKAYAGTCPDFVAGKLEIESAGYKRRAYVSLPDEPNGAPVVFLWHGLGDTAANMKDAFGADALAKKTGAVVITPDSCCNAPGAPSNGKANCCVLMTGWGFTDDSPKGDAQLFDDLLSCADSTLKVDRTRVYTTGFSAGALWSTWLLMHRADYLAAAVLFSGGVNDFVPYLKPTYKLPVLSAWGGDSDIFMNGLIDFQASSADLRKNLRKDGHFVVGCNHGGGHTVPGGGPKFAFDFLLQHVWKDGASPLQAGGLPATFPKYCSVDP